MRYSQLTWLIALTTCGCNETFRSSSEGSSSNQSIPSVESTDRDNSSVNQRDREGITKTPIDQNENQRDINVTAEVRKRLVGTNMSTNAQNVKIITQNGQVTLRGPVKSLDEKKRIEEVARAVAGNTKVDSQLEIEKNP
jgi:osmotically-inducible protein OsmY